MNTLKENSEQISECLASLECVDCRQSALSHFIKLEELYSERTVLFSQTDERHETYSAEECSFLMSNAFKLMIKILEKL